MAEDNHNLPPSNHSGTSPSAMFLEMMRQAAARRAEAEEGYSVEPEPEMPFHDLNFQLTPDTSDPIIEANTDENDVVDSDIKEDSFLVEAEQDNDIDVAILPTPEKIKPFIEATLVGHDSTDKIMRSEKAISKRESQLIKNDSVQITIQDTGTGILKRYEKNILKPFFQVNPEQLGLGLGLSITDKILELHEGHLQISSLAQGTKVIIEFPISKS